MSDAELVVVAVLGVLSNLLAWHLGRHEGLQGYLSAMEVAQLRVLQAVAQEEGLEARDRVLRRMGQRRLQELEG